jgi:DNA-binding winged helix-turn-helix (wHTH) protein/tetratricopeptide (TPR) repeat protein
VKGRRFPHGFNNLYEFDPFRVDVVRGVLLRQGEPVTLTAKTFDLLLVLIRHRHETVLKDDILKEVWPGTFVEESNLTQHISMLRKALGEAPQERRFIATVPARGYRFVAEVREIPDVNGAPAQIRAATTAESAVPEMAESVPGMVDSPSPALQRPSRVLRGRHAAIALAVILGALAVWVAVRQVRRGSASSRTLNRKDSVLLVDFENTTGEPVFDGALNEGLAVALGQSPFLDLASRARIRETLGFMGRSPEEPVRLPFAREVCERLGSEALIAGAIARLGNTYVISLDAQACNDGSVLAREQVQAKRREEVLVELGKAGRRLRGRLGESLASIEKFDVPIQQATTPSLEALKAYSLGVDQRARGAEKESVPFFARAFELDPGFAMAYAQSGGAYNNLGESERAAEAYKKAFSIKRDLSEREKLFLTVHYYETVEGDTEKAIETNEIWTRMYPRDPRPFNSLAAWYQVVGQYDKAVGAARSAMQLEPGSYVAYANLATSYLALNRFDEARQAADLADKMGRDSIYTHRVRFDLAFIAQDQGALQREVEWGKRTERQSDMIATEARALAAAGKLTAARKMFEQSWRSSRTRGLNDNAAYSMAQQALAEADLGNFARAKELAAEALSAGHGIDAEESSAEAFAFSGDRERTLKLIDELQHRYPRHLPLNQGSLPSAMGAIELQRGNPKKAIEVLEQAVPYDLSEFASLSPPFVRGIAYVRAGRGHEAVEQFQKILDHPGIDTTSQRHNLARLWAGRAYLAAGDTARARKAYEDFFAAWSGADKDIPILEEARREYSILK